MAITPPVPERAELPLTVVIPVHNRERSLPDTLRSIERQRSYRVSRVIIVDDASTDGSVAVARELGHEVLELKVNGGAAAARNAGLALVETDWVAFVDSDDTWRPNLLETQWPKTAEHVLVAGTAVLAVDGVPVSLIGTARSPGRLLTGPADLISPENRVVTSTTLVPTALVKELQGFNASLRYSEDMDLWLRVLAHGTGWVDAELVLTYNRGPSSKSQHARGVDEAREQIIASYAGRGWWPRSTAERYYGGMRWDAARTALRARLWRPALGHLLALARSPFRVQGAVQCVRRHGRLRRRLRQLSPPAA
jgi:glycosyltransferase involved in cell wall biosynthesis